MKFYKKNFGITLIALVVTIIVLLILAGISISMLTGQNGILNRATEAKEKTEEAQKEEQIKLAVMSSIGTDGLINLNQLKAEIERQGGSIAGTTFPVAVTTGNTSYQVDQYGNVTKETKNENIEENWTVADISNNNDDWYAYKDSKGKKSQVNAPKLANGMTAIKYNTEVNGSKWANAVTKDGSMWVWIPRYAYKITYKNKEDKSAGGTIDIAFLKGTTNEFLDSSIQGDVKTSINDVTYTDNANGTKSQNQWLLEPAFTFGDENIEGFWFAKFEASNTDGYGDDVSTANNANLTIRIKPNVTSWRNITAANIFTTCLNLTNSTNYKTYFNNVSNVDTHMTKNVEWGAVVYLAHSKFGLNGEEIGINANSSYKTGIGNDGSSVYNTEVGEISSTTKNVYGVYDMSGGAFEYVAACYAGYIKKLTENEDEAYISKYIEVYDSYSPLKFGDAMFETSSSSSGSDSWFDNYLSFVISSSPVFVRGGNYVSDSGAGLFFFYGSVGYSNNNNGFRPVCIVK